MHQEHDWAAYLYGQMGMPLAKIPLIILSAVLMYLAFLLIIRIFGARIFTATTFSSTIGFVMLGALSGRAILGPTPTVAAGIVALVTLVAMEAMFHAVESTRRARYAIGGRPVLVYLDGQALSKQCQHTKTTKVDLDSAMRHAGIGSSKQVRCIIMEPHGQYSVIRVGEQLEPALFKHVVGAELLFPNSGQ